MSLLITPRLSEKGYSESKNNVYIFNVPMDVNKHQIAEAVHDQFKVTVADVNVLVEKGHKIFFNRGKKRYPGTTYHADTKKAYVTLKKGDHISAFDESKESAKDNKKVVEDDKKETK